MLDGIDTDDIDTSADGLTHLERALALTGGVGRDLLTVDWSATALGPIDQWPRSLGTMVRTLLGSRFSMWMAWGPELTFFCNEAYRRDTLGTKYPWALGRPASEVWAEIWPDIGPRIEQVVGTGASTWDEGLLLFLERSGYVEETYHTFSYSPLTDDEGRISGMLCVVSEDTDRVIGERRMRTLRDLSAGTSTTRTEEDVLTESARHLAANPYCLPFTLTYLRDDDGTLRLRGRTGLPEGHPAAPAVLDTRDPACPWPLPQPGLEQPAPQPPGPGPHLTPGGGPDPDLDPVSGGGTTGPVMVAVNGLRERFPSLPGGAWTDPPDRALVVPLTQQGGPQPAGFIIAGLNPYRPLDGGYHGFVGLVAGQVAAGIAAARAYEAERRRAEALTELDRAKTDFFMNVSHEFRTPLTLLLSPAEDAMVDLADPLSAGQRDRVKLMHRNALRLLKLVNTLLDFSRLESGRSRPRLRPTDLSRRTVELVSLFAPAVERAGLSLEIDCPPLPAPVPVDREMWAKILLNLLSNALKFTFTGGITVRLRARAGVAELSVTDTGVGIDPSEHERLFERFHRVSGVQSRSHEGSGIGLALVAELAAVHGGGVSVESVPGTGSRFTVTVPLAGALGPFAADEGALGDPPPGDLPGDLPTDLPGEEYTAEEFDLDQLDLDQLTPDDGSVGQQAESFLAEALRWVRAGGGRETPPGGLAAPEAPDAPGEADESDDAGEGDGEGERRRRRLLVVDDNADMREYLVSLLSDRYAVDAAEDGLEALRLVAAHPPDLVLTDVMMPHLDGLGLLRELRADPATALVPVVMLSARAGSESAIDGLDAGADDYLVKPFSARELRARVRANLELDRTRRASTELERSRTLLDQAQRLAGVGSWELDLTTGAMTASDEFVRQVGLTLDELRDGGMERLLALVHPDDASRARAAVLAAAAGASLDLEVRLRTRDGAERVFHALGEPYLDAEGRPARLRGSNQDVTEQRRAELTLAAAAASREAAAREHRIADELQRSLLPAPTFTPEHLTISTYYRAGVEGTEVGGDWFDVIELGAERAALVMGDVMGRGVRAAAVMGQLRAAVRAYARLDLPPGDLLALMDGVVRDLGEDQIVTCVYAVYDPGDRTLTYANAGHLPPLLAVPGSPVERLTGAAGPPLGIGPLNLTEARIELPVGALLTLYTDGLVEQRDRDIDTGIDTLTDKLASIVAGDLEDVPRTLVAEMLAGGPDDDIAVLVVHVAGEAEGTDVLRREVPAQELSVAQARRDVTDALGRWKVPERQADDIVLVVSELVTNAVVHGQPPIELRMRRTETHVVVEVQDAATLLPRRARPTPDDEHGRGLHLVALLSERWGTRPTAGGKSVWCLLNVG